MFSSANISVFVYNGNIQFLPICNHARKKQLSRGGLLDAFEKIYKENYSGVFLFLYKLCHDEKLAEELTQETFYQAFTSFYKFEGKCEISTWLAAIGKHTYFKYLRKNKLDIDSISLDSVTESYRERNFDNPEDAVQKEYIVNAIRNIVDNIPDKYRDVVILRVYAGLPYSQVAKALNISENSAKVIFFRAKKMLMEEIKNELNM